MQLLHHSTLGKYGFIATQAGDPTASRNMVNSTALNAGFGAYLSDEKFYLGVSALNLYSNVYSANEAKPLHIASQRRFYVMTGYHLGINNNVKLNPNFLIDVPTGDSPKINLTFLVEYKDMLDIGLDWIGLDWAAGDAIKFLSRVKISELIVFGYSYDFHTTELGLLNTGSHEVMLGATF
ncbi:MAG: type IX secretion system membrane protein PorP/SprF [Flavobacteriales bacterium]|nr:type IX secretion system membrane protein PorP/SprF [Flavobacteriales bacterium]